MKKGFTLIELLVVGTILAVLAAGAFVSYSTTTARSRDSKRLSDIEQVRSALEMFRADNASYYQATGSVVSTLGILSPDYISKLPSDPKFASTFDYYYNSAAPAATYELCAKTENLTDPGTCTCSDANYNYCTKNP